MTLSEMVAQSIKDIRVHRGLTQGDLSDLSGVTERTISTIETGRHDPSLDTIEKLITALKLSPLEFFSFDLKGKASDSRLTSLIKISDDARGLTDDGLALLTQFVDMLARYETTRTPSKRTKKT